MKTSRTVLVPFAWAFLACSSTTTGTNSADEGPDASAAVEHHDLVVFTTKATLQGDLGGLTGADTKCTTYANAAGLQGQFRAWLSDTKTDAIDRVPEGGPWRVLTDGAKQGEVAFANRDGWKGYPKVLLEPSEFGAKVGVGEVPYTWTGTALGGTRLGGCSCSDWKSSENPSKCSKDYGGIIGSRAASATSEQWTNVGPNPCDQRSSLLCFQVP